MFQFLFGLALLIIGYILMPKPKAPKPPATTELDGPTAEAGREMPVIFGDLTVKSPNFLGWWDKSYVKKSKKVGKK